MWVFNFVKEIANHYRKHTVEVFVYEYPNIVIIQAIGRQNVLLAVWIFSFSSQGNTIYNVNDFVAPYMNTMIQVWVHKGIK